MKHRPPPLSRSGSRRRRPRVTGRRGAPRPPRVHRRARRRCRPVRPAPRQRRRPEPRAPARHRRDRAHAHAACDRARHLSRRQSASCPAGAQLVGVRGATKLVLTDGASLIAATGADHVTLSGLVLDGAAPPLPDRRGLVHLETCRRIKIADCEIMSAGGNGIVCIAVDGEIIDTRDHRQRRRRDPLARCARRC